jgi:transposase
MARVRTSLDTQKQILELHSQGRRIRAIAKILGKSRKTVRKIISQGEALKDIYQPSWAKEVDWSHVQNEVRRGVTLKQLYREYNLSSSEASFRRHWKRCSEILTATDQVTMRLEHKPAEKTFFDFCDGLYITDPKTGNKKRTQLLCGVMPFSSYTFGEFVWDQKQPTMMRAMENAFYYFGGTSSYVTVDNLKSGVTRAHLYDPDVNKTFVDFANHYGFAVIPARPRKPRDKAANEGGIGVIQRQFFQEVRDRIFYSLADLNAFFREYLERLNTDKMKDWGVSRRERFANETLLLKTLPVSRYEIAEWKSAIVHSDCHIQVDKKFYSVPYQYVSQTVRVKKTDKLIDIFNNELEPIATHLRIKGTDRCSTIEAHYPEKKLALARFEVKHALSQASKIGPTTELFVKTLVETAHPLQFLRRAQGILQLFKSGQISQPAMEYACNLGMNHKKMTYNYIKAAAIYFDKYGARPKLTSSPPARAPGSIYLHSDYNNNP